jgi:hypothetical protein
MSTRKPMPLWAKSLCVFILAVSSLYVYAVGKASWQMVSQAQTYSQVCLPQLFIRKVDYYNGRTFLVCGGSTTEPTLKEYPRQ